VVVLSSVRCRYPKGVHERIVKRVVATLTEGVAQRVVATLAAKRVVATLAAKKDEKSILAGD
jgi:hypothetical protein